MLWLIDNCQNKVSANQYHMIISWAQIMSSERSCVFLKLTPDPILAFPLDHKLKLGYYAGGEGGSICKGNFWRK